MIYSKNNRKNFPETIGVYKISFINNSGKVYIGSTSNKKGFRVRWNRHLSTLSKNKSNLPALQNAANKYNVNNMIFEVLEECKKENCVNREQYYIDKYDSYYNGYNSRPFARTNLTLKFTKEHIDKLKNIYKDKRKQYYDEVVYLYNIKLLSIEKISQKINKGREFVSKILKENNISIRTDRMNKIQIYQYKLSGEYINNFNSIRECARKMNTYNNIITDVLNGRCRHANNYYYSTKKLSKCEVLNNLNSLKLNTKEYTNICQIDQNNNIIKNWNNIKDIHKYYNFSIQNIRKSIRNKSKYQGYYWVIW